jgi:hypothetical protein
MKEARIIIPMFNLFQGAIIARHLIAAFGGLTETVGYGAWVDPKGETIHEQIKVFDIAYAGDNEGDNKLFDIANAYRIDAEQTEVYLRYGNGEVQMVRDGSKMENGEFDWTGLMGDLGHDIDDPVVLAEIAS